jgi:hypothetical protein
MPDNISFDSQSFAPSLNDVPNTSVVPTEFEDISDANSKMDRLDTAAIKGYEDIIWKYIPKFQLPTQPSQHRSWIWTEGYEIEETKTGDKYWLCKKCHIARKHQSHMWKVSGGTSRPLKHMKQVHQLTEDGPATKKRTFFEAFKQADGSLTSRDRDIVHRLITAFNPERFKTKLTRWIVHDNIAFNQVESPYFRDMMLELDGSLRQTDYLPTHRTIRDWIMRDFNRFKGIVAQHLQNALSKIHASFDLWTSRNLLTLCGTVVHFIDNEGKLCTFLLSLPELVGSHTGVNIAESVTTIIHDYKIGDRIGYFVLDNADNNDTAMTALAEKFEFDAKER